MATFSWFRRCFNRLFSRSGDGTTYCAPLVVYPVVVFGRFEPTIHVTVDMAFDDDDGSVIEFETDDDDNDDTYGLSSYE